MTGKLDRLPHNEVSHESQRFTGEKSKSKLMQKLRKTETRLEILDPEKAAIIRRDAPARMSLSEASCYCGMSPRTLRDNVRKRRISMVKIGGRILFRKEQLDADLERNEQKAI